MAQRKYRWRLRAHAAPDGGTAGSPFGHVEMSFPYFINKKAPYRGVESLLDYDVTFIGEIRDGTTFRP